MNSVVSTILALAAACYLVYATTQGYRTGILKARGGPYDRSKQPKAYWFNLIALTILSVVAVGAVVVLIYGQTHPGWRPPFGH